MASVSRDEAGSVRILFIGTDRKRRAIYLGKVTSRLAATVRLRVEALVAAAMARVPLDPETAAWVGGIGDDLAAKLAVVGLIPERPKAVTLDGLLDLYLKEKEGDNKAGTRTNHRTLSKDLCDFFGMAVDSQTITADDAKKFLDHLKDRDLASATVARRIRRARSVFAFAVKRKLISSNPFGEIRFMSVLPAERKAYVPAADTETLIAAASPTWRTIIALARHAGLRCPSEVLMLKW